ncbi:hypothetical protein D3C81_923790 [compost metagenome]
MFTAYDRCQHAEKFRRVSRIRALCVKMVAQVDRRGKLDRLDLAQTFDAPRIDGLLRQIRNVPRYRYSPRLASHWPNYGSSMPLRTGFVIRLRPGFVPKSGIDFLGKSVLAGHSGRTTVMTRVSYG